ncbi:isochorismatase family protein [Cryptobacterium curtum]|uniref:isochorismatase family protein n=1 Tax=Cryptobacterium curtum TaxID=84163 RepID=UPI0028D4079D|nr:isochorismatase family protein [Cryptobacterium curtum]
MPNALVLVDVQNDFCTGTLAVEDGPEVACAIASYVREQAADYDYIVTTQDWHIDPGSHFSDQPDFRDSWPIHCVADTWGSELFTDVCDALNTAPSEKVVSIIKGMQCASYSGFEGVLRGDSSQSMDAFLTAQGITNLVIVGIATDYCVDATIRDAVQQGYHVETIASLCAGINADRVGEIYTEYPHLGVTVR